jgi:hypothetical protein
MKERTQLNFRGPTGLVLAVDVAAVAALITLPAAGMWDPPGTILLLLALAAASGFYPVRLPFLKLEMTATHPFILVALAALGPVAAALVGLAGIIGGAIGRGRSTAAFRLAFNLGAVTLCVAASSWAFLAAGGHPGQTLSALFFPLSVATVTYFFANTGLVAAAIALEKRQSYFATWAQTFLWTPLSYLMGLTLAILMLAVLKVSVMWAVVLVIPACLLLVLFYRARAARAPASSA